MRRGMTAHAGPKNTVGMTAHARAAIRATAAHSIFVTALACASCTDNPPVEGDDDADTGTPSATPTAVPDDLTPTDTPDSTPTATPGPTPVPTPLADPCADVPVYTWNNFGEGFVIENCQTCHASTSPNRYGAPLEVYFDTRESTLSWEARILARATGANPTMPPGGGVSDDDRWRLEVWLTCWE